MNPRRRPCPRPSPAECRRHRRRRALTRLVAETLEPRHLLAVTAAAADGFAVSAGQAAALYGGISGLTSRLAEIQEAGLLASEAVALGQPVGTLLPLGDRLRTSLVDRLGGLAAGGATTVGDIRAAFAAAAAADPVLATAHVTATLETDGPDQRLWFSVALAGDATLPDYALDLGQGGAADSLLDQGLTLGPVEVALTAGFSGTIDFGIDLAPGLTAGQSALVRFDDLRAFGAASHTGATALADIEARFGIVQLGPAAVDVALDVGVTFDLAEPAVGWMTVGELAAASAADWLAAVTLSPSGAGLDVTIPYTLDIAGFGESLGSSHAFGITAADLLDPASLEIAFPQLTIPGSGAFDFSQLAAISASDLGVFLADLGRWVPELGRDFELPLVGRDLAGLFRDDFSDRITSLVAALQDADGGWAFTTVQEMIDGLAGDLGLAAADFALTWNPASEALEWTLPLAVSFTATESFDAGVLVPAGLPLDLAAAGSATIDLSADFAITAGAAITSSANVTPVTTATLLADLNGGAGLTAGMLIAGNDLEFTLRDGRVLGFDLDTLDIAAGTATVQDLIDLVTTPGQLDLAIDASRLVATDRSTPASAAAVFSVSGPSVTVVIGSTSTVQTSLAPLALGLLVAPTAGDTLTGHSLERFSARDRVYLAAASVATFDLTLTAALDAGASLGPLALSVVCGRAEGSADVTATLVDPGTAAAADGLVFLAEMEDDLAGVIDLTVVAPQLEGVFQLQVAPASLATSLGIDAADYVDFCSGLPLATLPGASVPYLDLDLDLDGDWSFSVTPSPALQSLATGLGTFSIGDLPNLLDLFTGYLEGSGLWDFAFPWIDRSLGDLFGFADAFAELPAFALGDLLGLPEYDAGGALSWPALSLGGLGGDLLDAYSLALPDLAGLDLFDRLQRLVWSLDDLLIDWEGWSPGSSEADLDFLGRIRGWFAEARLVFPDLWGAWHDGAAGLEGVTLAFGRLLWLPQFSWPDASVPDFDTAWLGGIDVGDLEASFPGLDFGGLSDFGRSLGRLEIGGNPLALTLAVDPSGRLVFTLTVDADFDTTVPIPALDLGGVPLDVSTSGALTVDLGGSITGVFGVDLDTGLFFFDDTGSSIDLTARIDSDGLGMLATLGGVAGVAIGRPDDAAAPAAWVQAEIDLGSREDTDGDGDIDAADAITQPARFALDGAGTLAVDAAFAALLPLYVFPEIPGVDPELGALQLDAAFAVTPVDGDGDGTPDGSTVATPTLTIGGVDDILANLTNLSFSFDSWIDGAAELVAYLRTVLASDLVAGLPLVNRVDVSDAGLLGRLEGFFELLAGLNTPGELWTQLEARLSAIEADIEATTGDRFDFGVGFTLDGSPLEPLDGFGNANPDWEESFGDLLTGDVEFVVGLTLASTTTTRLGPDAIDFGVDALGLEIVGDAAIDLATTFALDLGLGASLTRGFFVDTVAGSEFTAGFDLSLPESLALRLGPLVFAYEDTTTAPELEADLTVDFTDGSYGLANLGDLFAGLAIGGTVRAEVAADLSAEIFAGLGGPGLGISLATGFNGPGEPGGGPVTVTDVGAEIGADNFFFTITDTFIDLGGLLSGPIKEIFVSLDAFLEPLRPVLDLLTGEVPVLSDVSKTFGGGAITVLDVIRTMGGGDYDGAVAFIETVDQAADFIDTLGGIAGSSKVSLGSVSLPSGVGGTASAAELRTELERGALNPTDAGFTAGTDASGAPILTTPADASGDVGSAYTQVESGSIEFPLFADPVGALVDLLFGGNPSLVHWDLPDLSAGFTLDQSIPIFPPLFARFFGGFAFSTDVSLGYDTRGIRQALAAETVRPAKILNGVYLGDVADVTDPGSADTPEFTFTATLGAGAELNVVVAKAGVAGGVEGMLGANLKDPNDDGKVHLDELVANLRSGPECIFDFEGAIDAFFEAFIKVGVDVPFVGFVTLWQDTFELFDLRLYDWNLVTCPPVEPSLAAIVTGPYDHDNDATTAAAALPGGVSRGLVLNTGPRAGLVLPGETRDGDEVFEIDYDAATAEIIVRAYDAGGEDRDGDGTISDAETGLRYAASGIDAILFDAGAGNDVIRFTAALPTSIAVYGFGGPGDDQLTGAPGPNTLHGDGGSVSGAGGRDRILGRQSDDALTGGDGNDIVFGYGGSDAITGNGGADQLFGDDESGDLSTAPDGFRSGVAGDDLISGGDDGDTIFGGAGHDRLLGGSGDDTIDAGAGNDWIEGGGGNDTLYGRDGTDLIWGEDQAGSITATGRGPDDGSALDVNADLIEGGAGFNFIHGGPGYDVIYAESEAVGAAAAASHPGWDIAANVAIPMQSGTVRFVDAVGDWLVAGGWPTAEAARGGTVFVALLVGGDGNDTLYGTVGRDYIAGGFESDFIQGGAGDDYLLGGPGSDAIFAGGGSARGATIFGGDGDDVIDGGGYDGPVGGSEAGYANWIEGGPGDDRIFGREGADTIHGGTTGVGYAHYEDDRSGPRAVIDAIHGGYTATVSADDCGPEISWYPEVYPEESPPIQGLIYEDRNANGRRDAGEPTAPIDVSWGIQVSDARGAPILLGSVAGGGFTVPAAGGLPAGDYTVALPLGRAPAGWVASTTTLRTATVAAAGPAAVLEFGWYRTGSIGGKVVGQDGSDAASQEGVTVFLDADKDGQRDEDEPDTVTAADGTYAFDGLVPGDYRVAVVPPTGCVVVTPSAADITVTGLGQPRIDFLITARSAPVVEAVLLGVGEGVVNWTAVPDGPAQATPLPVAEYGVLAFELCAGGGLAPTTAGAGLVPLDAAGNEGPAITLVHLGTSPAAPNRLRYEIVKPLGQNALPAGRYRLKLSAASVTAATGVPLDGEWINPSPAAADGSRYPSGDGTAGGDFVFEFEIGGVMSQAGGGVAVLAATSGATIEGTVWQHDPRDPEMGQSATEVAVRGAVVHLLDAGGAVLDSQVAGPIDLDGDGIVRGAENAAFRFTGVAPGTVTVVQTPVDPWAQATPGGVLREAELLAAVFDNGPGKSQIWSVGLAPLGALLEHETSRLAVRDIAVLQPGTAWLVGEARDGNALAPGAAGLWQIDRRSGDITEIGPTPGTAPLVSFDALDGRHLVGITAAGEVLRYDTLTGAWQVGGPLVTAGGQRLYPVGDAAVVGPREVYVVALTERLTKPDDNAAGLQKLVKLDPATLGANATIVRDLAVSELLVGLETGPGDGLVGLGTGKGLYTVPTTATGSVVRLGGLAPLGGVLSGGLARTPGGLEIDPARDTFLLPLTGGETVTVGFGNEPVLSTLLDGDDTIDGGCGDAGDALHGDDGPGLPWYVTTIGGNDTIRGRGGDDTIRGGQQGDRLLGGDGQDDIRGGDTEPNWIDGGDGDDRLTGGAADDTILGGDGADTLDGLGGGDRLLGDSGDDTLRGGDGPDMLVGGAGTDAVFGDAGDDTLVVIDTASGGGLGAIPAGLAADVYDGGGGVDTIVVSADTDTTLTDTFVTLLGDPTRHTVLGVEAGLLTGGAGANTIDAAGFSGSTVIRGLAGADTLSGGAGPDTILGGSGSNTLTGNAADDIFIADGSGDDRILDVAAADTDTLDLSAVAVALELRVGATSPTEVEVVTVTGSGRAVFAAAAIERVLLGSGDDVVFVRDGRTTVARIDAGAGVDALRYAEIGTSGSLPDGIWSTAVAVDLAAGTATGTGGITGFEQVTGGAGDDTLRGDDGANVLAGGAGADTLDGRGGDDELRGDGGDDTLLGGAGADTLIGHGGTNTLAGGADSDRYLWLAGDEPIDTVSEAAGAGEDVLDFTGVGVAIRFDVGTAVVATYGAARVEAASAGDIETVVGGAAADRFALAAGTAYAGLLDGGAVLDASFAQMNTLDYTAWTTPVAVDLTGQSDPSFLGSATGAGQIRWLQHVIGGAAADSLVAGGQSVWFEGGDGDDTVSGSSQADLLEGQAGADTISGNAGADTLRGGLGSDTLAGGPGDDTYAFVDLFGNDTIVELPAEGTDTLDFALVTVPLEIRLGSVAASDGTFTALHAGNDIESVIGGAAADTFVMTGPSVVFPGTLDGGGSANTLLYEQATAEMFAAVEAGQTPNVTVAERFATIRAVANLHDPVFTSMGTGTVEENAPSSTVIYQAVAGDADAAPENAVTYAVAAGLGDDAALVTIDPVTGEVRLLESANYEARSSYTFTVVATDAGTPARSTQQAVSVAVTDVEEPRQPPQLVLPAGLTFLENTPGVVRLPGTPFVDADSPGTTVMTVVLDVGSGTLSAAAGDGVTVGGRRGRRTFTGTLDDLNAFFTAAEERIGYRPAAGVTGVVPLTVRIRERAGRRLLESKATVPLTIEAIDDPPQLTVPDRFVVVEDVASGLRWSRRQAFADPDSPRLTVRLAVDAGTLAVRSRPGVTVSGDATSVTLEGRTAALNALFARFGSLRYTTPADATDDRRLTVTVSDGVSSVETAATIAVRPVNDPPVVAAAATLLGAGVGTPVEFTHADLVTATAATDIDSETIVFAVDRIRAGQLERWTGSRWRAVRATGRVAARSIAAGDRLRWTPPSDATGSIGAFRLRVRDEATWSRTPVDVSVDLTGG